MLTCFVHASIHKSSTPGELPAAKRALIQLWKRLLHTLRPAFGVDPAVKRASHLEAASGEVSLEPPWFLKETVLRTSACQSDLKCWPESKRLPGGSVWRGVPGTSLVLEGHRLAQPCLPGGAQLAHAAAVRLVRLCHWAGWHRDRLRRGRWRVLHIRSKSAESRLSSCAQGSSRAAPHLRCQAAALCKQI